MPLNQRSIFKANYVRPKYEYLINIITPSIWLKVFKNLIIAYFSFSLHLSALSKISHFFLYYSYTLKTLKTSL